MRSMEFTKMMELSEQERVIVWLAARDMLQKVFREEMPVARRGAAQKALRNEAWPLSAVGRDRVEAKVEKRLVERLVGELVAYHSKELAKLGKRRDQALEAKQLEVKFYGSLKAARPGELLEEALVAGLREEQLAERFVKVGLSRNRFFGLLEFWVGSIYFRATAGILLGAMAVMSFLFLVVAGRTLGEGGSVLDWIWRLFS